MNSQCPPQILESQSPLVESQIAPSNKGTTFTRTCFNGMNSLIGIGILSIPYALSQGGWTSSILFAWIVIVCFYTSILLKKCMDSNPNIKNFPDIGEEAFGVKGKSIVSIFLYLELFLLAVEFLILEGDNLHKLFPHVSVHGFGIRIKGRPIFIIITALVVLPTTWFRDLSVLAYVSACGILASVILVISVFCVGVFENVGFNEKGVLWKFKGLPTAMSLYTFCFSAHAVFPTLYATMENKKQFPKVLLVCFGLSTLLYGSMAVLGYMMYGQDLMSQITLNLPTKNVFSKIAIYATLVNPLTKYAIYISPIATALEEAFVAYRKNNNTILMTVSIRTTLVISTMIVALVIPFFGYVMAFIGAFLSSGVTMVIPCLCYLKIHKISHKFKMRFIFILVIIVFGCFIAVVGTYVSVKDIIKHVNGN